MTGVQTCALRSAAMNNAARIEHATALSKASSSSIVRPLLTFRVIKLIAAFQLRRRIGGRYGGCFDVSPLTKARRAHRLHRFRQPVDLGRMELFSSLDTALVMPGTSNKCGINALSRMQKRKPLHIGPMSMQPVDHSSTMPAPLLPAMPCAIGADRPNASQPKMKPTRIDAMRAAKARIMRRNSLQKQRQAQKR